jgi:hypothetical protein
VVDIVLANDHGHQVQRKSDRQSRRVIFAISGIGIFEIKGSENSPNAEPQNFIGDKHRFMAQGHVERWIRVVSRAEIAYIDCRRRAAGLEASRLIRQSHGHRLENSWMSGLILIPMKIANESGGWSLKPHFIT